MFSRWFLDQQGLSDAAIRGTEINASPVVLCSNKDGCLRRYKKRSERANCVKKALLMCIVIKACVVISCWTCHSLVRTNYAPDLLTWGHFGTGNLLISVKVSRTFFSWERIPIALLLGPAARFAIIVFSRLTLCESKSTVSNLPQSELLYW